MATATRGMILPDSSSSLRDEDRFRRSISSTLSSTSSSKSSSSTPRLPHSPPPLSTENETKRSTPGDVSTAAAAAADADAISSPVSILMGPKKNRSSKTRLFEFESPLRQSAFVSSPFRSTSRALLGLCVVFFVFFPFERVVDGFPSAEAKAKAEVAASRGSGDADVVGGSVSGDGGVSGAENLNSKGETNPKKVINGFVDEGGNSASHIVKFDCSKAHHKRQEVHPPHCHNGGVMVEIHGGFHEAMPYQTCHCLCPAEWTGPMCSLPIR